MNLEKFCIVKRRKQCFEDPFHSLLSVTENKSDSWPFPPSPKEEMGPKEESVLSLNLTPMQGRTIRSGGIIPMLDTKTPQTFTVDLHREEDGVVIFNFHFQNSMMLNPQQVCQMMQISRSFLNRMVVEKKIKSYKIGRLRRFFLNDIMENLNKSQFESHDGVSLELIKTIEPGEI